MLNLLLLQLFFKIDIATRENVALPTHRLVVGTPDVKRLLAYIATGEFADRQLFLGLNEAVQIPPQANETFVSVQIDVGSGNNSSLFAEEAGPDDRHNSDECAAEALQNVRAMSARLEEFIACNANDPEALKQVARFSERTCAAVDCGVNSLESWMARCLAKTTGHNRGAAIHVLNPDRRGYQVGSARALRAGRKPNGFRPPKHYVKRGRNFRERNGIVQE